MFPFWFVSFHNFHESKSCSLAEVGPPSQILLQFQISIKWNEKRLSNFDQQSSTNCQILIVSSLQKMTSNFFSVELFSSCFFGLRVFPFSLNVKYKVKKQTAKIRIAEKVFWSIWSNLFSFLGKLNKYKSLLILLLNEVLFFLF